MSISKYVNKFKLDSILLRVSYYCRFHEIENYKTNIGGYQFEITKNNITPDMCTFEDLVMLPNKQHLSNIYVDVDESRC